MVAVTTRAGKGSPLTNAEIDANWNALVADLNTKMTQAQARAAISVSGSLTYNSTTGVLGFTETPLTSANIVAALGFTPLSNAGGTLSGGLTVNGTLTQQGNQVLHASNYNTYVPTLTGAGANGTWGISISGNAATATSADQIDGWVFRNTGSNSGVNADTIDSNGITYYTGGVPNFTGNATDGALYSQAYSSSWQHQIAADYRSGQIALRGKNSGTWQAWRTVLDSGNYTSYTASRNGSGYLTPENWIQLNGNYGLYSPNNSAHFFPNTGSYGAWRVNGSRDGWRGINFDDSVVLMMNDNESGHHKNGYGWQFRWYNGTLYNYKNGYGGGTEAVVLDAVNYTNYAASAGHNHDGRYLRADTSNTMFSGQGSALAFENQGSFFRFAFNEVRFYDWQAGTDIFILNDSVYSSRNIRTASRIVVGEGQSSSWLEMYDDESPNGKKYLHANSNLIGFVGGDGNWKAYVREDGHFWTAAYGWLNDYFFRSVSNCAGQLDQVNENCYNCGNIFQGSRNELIDEGGNLRIRRIGTYVNCNCACK